MTICRHHRFATQSNRVFEVVGIWAIGSGVNYKPVAYDLEDTDGKITTIERAQLIELIETNKLKQI